MIDFRPPKPEQFFSTTSIGTFAVNRDETRIVFSTNLDGKPNVWAMDMDHLYPYQLTMVNQEANFLEFDPDGSFILAGFDNDGDENFQIYALPPGGGEPVGVLTGDKDEKYFFGQLSDDGRFIYYTTSRDNPTHLNICRYDLETESDEVLLENEETVAEFGEASPDGEGLVYSRAYSNTFQAAFYLAGETSTPLVPDPEVPHVVHQPVFLNPNTICFATDYKADFRYLAKFTVDTGQFEKVAEFENQSITLIRHDKPNARLWLFTSVGVQDHLYTYDLSGGTVVEKDLPVGTVWDFKLSRRGNPYIRGTSTRTPDNIYRYIDGAWQRLTENRVLGVSEEDMSEAEVFRYESFDGLEIEALFLEGNPQNANGWTVLWPHGGPQAKIAKFFLPPFQLLSYAGYNVFAPNFRGSTGYGSTFTRMIEREWGEAPRKDILEGLHYLVREGRVDPEKVLVMGGSFGGYMTLLLHGRNAGEFQAFIDLFGPSNLITFVNSVPDHWKPMMRDWVGDPEEDHDRLVKDSPITYLDHMTKPMLVVQGVNDPRVVKEESDQIVEALRAKGTPVEYIVLDDEGHGFSKKENELRTFRQVLDFVNKYCAD